MNTHTLRIRRHYTGLFVGHCLEDPSLMVMGRDQEEVALLAARALAARREPARGQVSGSGCEALRGS